MGVTAKLLALYLVDKQLQGLTGSLRAAESYLQEQDRLLNQIGTKHAALSSQVRQLEATSHNDETEAKSIDGKIEKLRDRMNSARTSKEHAALLTEINTLKADRGLIEERALESMGKLDAIRKQLAEIDAERGEREKVRGVAAADRDKREAEIRSRLDELKAERRKAADELPGPILAEYEYRLKIEPEAVMAPVEEQDRRNMDYTCGSCYTHLPIEQVSILLKRGDLTKCPSCKTILYMEQTLRESINTSHEKKSKGRKTVPQDDFE